MTKFAADSVKRYVYKPVKTPVGELKLCASDTGLAAVLWENDEPTRVRVNASEEGAAHPVLLRAERELNEYFAGERKQFTVPLDFVGTGFQRKVWRALLDIPYGETRTYAQLAQHLGDIKLTRAVGAANGRNPISIIAPCHRVIGTSGELVGFAGGLAAKAWLLTLEGSRFRPERQPGLKIERLSETQGVLRP
jgi:methylated-DNA-[protein]-cysteine S-methyltransferase